MSFADREVRCVSCSETFVFSSGEQEFFLEKGFVNEPKHCKQCKAKRTGERKRSRIETHVNCAQCGSDTTVPFKPTHSRPVLCATCYRHRPTGSEVAAA
jgi:CxxC-x17-CxxC domain-containing protein